MSNRFQYLKAVILDWAGTTVDRGSLAPVRTIQRLFGRHGVAVTEEDARREMGLPKRERGDPLAGAVGCHGSPQRQRGS